MTNSRKNTATRLANQLRENPAQFIQQSIQPEGVFHTTGFKEYLETGLPFILYLEEADRPYLQADYWVLEGRSIVIHQLLASAHIPLGETGCRWVATAHYKKSYRVADHIEIKRRAYTQAMALDVWEQVVTGGKKNSGTWQEAWLFPCGLNKAVESEAMILYAANYHK